MPKFPFSKRHDYASSCGLFAAAGLLLTAAASAQITAVPLPDPKIPNFKFPEAEGTIVGWVDQMSTAQTPPETPAFGSIHLHGWGLWTALTSETDQVLDGQKLRVFETWHTPDELVPAQGDPQKARAFLAAPRPSRAPFQKFNQFHHAKLTNTASNKLTVQAAVKPEEVVIGFVKYDPSAATHITQQGLLSKSMLTTLLEGGAKQVPTFPVTAIALKPVFSTASNLVDGRYYQLAVWPGPPTQPQPFPQDQWGAWVWVDIQGGGQGNGKVDHVGKRTDDTTYPVSSFINFRLNAADANSANVAAVANGGAGIAKPGDYAILVGMHVAGREITRWTWETFWWTPDPANPPAPSSQAIANLRPKQLQNAPAHYAMALAYNMKNPVQPYVGGTNTGDSVYAYNPYLEAPFDGQILSDSAPGYSGNKLAGNNVGVQSNCMSCHGNANYTPTPTPPLTAPGYTGNRYVDLDDPRFKGTLQVDFLWSLPNHAQ